MTETPLAHVSFRYKNKVELTGLVYLHRITDNRMGGSLVKYLNVFHKLCGQPSLDRVVLVSTMWHEVRSNEAREKAEARHKELKTRFWEPLIKAGSRCDCLESASRQEAWRIIDELIECSLAKRSDVRLQREIVREEKPLARTEAGQELVPAAQKKISELAESYERLSSEIEKLKRIDPALAEELKKEQQDIYKLLNKERAIAEKYKIPFTERIRKAFRKLFGKVSLFGCRTLEACLLKWILFRINPENRTRIHLIPFYYLTCSVVATCRAEHLITMT